MRRILSSILCFIFIFSIFSPTITEAKDQSNVSKPNVVKQGETLNSYIIKYKDAKKGKENLSKRNKKVKKEFKYLPSHIKADLNSTEAEDLKKDPNIAYIEQDNQVQKTSDAVSNSMSQIHVTEVQKQSIYGEGVKVAILDTGISTLSSELHVAGGVSFVEDEPSLEDRNGHGTFVAGILAALHDEQGLVGVAPKVDLYNIKVLDSSGIGTYSQVIQGIEWAIDNHIDIVSMSFSGSEYSQALEEAMQKAYDGGILLVASSGNDGKDSVSYPAQYSSVIAVGAVDQNNRLAHFSNTGEEIELVAPGVNILGLPLSGNNYYAMSGTSMAAPQVAGVGALLKSKNTSLTNQEIRKKLHDSAFSLGDANKFGHGLVNAAQSLGIPSDEYIPGNEQDIYVKPVIAGGIPSIGDTVNTSVYDVTMSASNGYPTTYDTVALNNVNLKPDQAPFSINSGNETISTLDGSLSLQNTDMALPGRNGLSFALTRTYSSTSSQYYNMDVESVGVVNQYIYPSQYVYMDEMDTNYNIYLTGTNPYATVDGTFSYTTSRGASWTMYPAYYTCAQVRIDDQGCMVNTVNYISQNHGTFFWTSPSSTSPDYRGTNLRSRHAINSYGSAPRISSNFLYMGIFNKTIAKTYEETMFPIGKGWSWNISSIEIKNGKRYLHLAGKGTYEIGNNNQLAGYPWKDVTISTNSSVNVNGETSYWDLKTLDGSHQYFNSQGMLIEISDAYGNTIKFTYSNVSPYGKVLTGITDSIDNTISINYTASTVTLTSGDKVVTYNKGSMGGEEILTSVVDPLGRRTSYTYGEYGATFNFPSNTTMNDPGYNPYGLLTRVIYPTGASTEYKYESSPVTRYFGPSGYNQAYRISQRYDLSRGVTYNSKQFSYSGDIGSSYNQSYSFNTTVNNGLRQSIYTNYKQYINDTTPAAYYTTNITEKAGTQQKTSVMEYDTSRRLPVPNKTTMTTSDGLSTSSQVIVSRVYDDYGNVTSETGPNNVQTTYSYDTVSRQLQSVTQPINGSLSEYIQYVRDSRTNSITQVTVHDKTSSGTVGELKSQYNVIYDSFGNITQVTVKDDNRNIIINKEYDALFGSAFLTKQSSNVTDVDGVVSTINEKMQYNKQTGSLTQYTDGKGYLTSYSYDKLGRVTSATFPDTSRVTITYDDINNKVTAVDQTGLTSVTQWNQLGWKTSTGISGSGFATYDYDSFGRLKWSKDALNHQTAYSYDEWDRLIRTIHPDGSTDSISYDDINFTKTATDAENNQLKETYDLLGRLTKKEWLKASGNITLGSYTYDYAGNVLSSSDGNLNTTTYVYDALSRLLSVTDAQMNKTQYSYSLSSKLTQVQYADGNKEFKQYDELGRLIKKIDPTGQVEKFYYDANNNPSKHVDRKGQVQTYSYNNRNFMISNVSASESVSYSYDQAGRRLTMNDVTGSTSYTYEPATKRLSFVTYPDGKMIKYQYDLQGNRTQMTDPFAINTVYGYDSRNRLTGVGAAANSWDATYTYKKNNLLSSVQQGNGITWAYGYDGLNVKNVTQSKTGGAVVGSYSYGYDNNFNQTSKTDNGIPYSFTYDPLNRIATSSQFTEQYSYDSRGNRQTMRSSNEMNITAASYTYDDRDRLTQVSTEDGKNVSYRYNGDGLLYERTENGVTTRYYYDGANMIAEANVTGGTATLKARYERGNGLVARVDAGGNKQYYLSNGHGDVTGLTDGLGNMLNSYSYDLWGNPVTTQESVPQPFRYSGEYWDSTAELQYLRARWYDPSIGRFMNEDTYEGQIGNPLSLNLYIYVSNNPLRYTDPTGHIQEGDENRGSFVYGQLQFITRAWEAAAGDPAMQAQIHATADYLRNVSGTGANYAIISMDTFLPVDEGTDPWGNTYKGNGKLREFGVNDLNVKTLQYGVINLDYNSVVGFNYVTVTERIDSDGNVILSKRDSNSGMYFTSNLNTNGGSNFTMVNAVTSASNELSLGAPSLDYSASIKISNKSDVSFSVSTDKFPAYEGYLSVNGGGFKQLYNLHAIPAPINPFLNLAVPRGTYSGSMTYTP